MRLETVRGWNPAMFEVDGMGAVTRWDDLKHENLYGNERTDMFSSKGSASSRAHIVCTVPLRTSRRKPLEATTSPKP